MKPLLILLLLSLPWTASSQNSLTDCKALNSAYEVTLQAQAKEISIKNVLISTYESNQKTMAARYVAREQQLQTEVDGWKKRFELSEADRSRLQKERNQNRKFIAPGLGGAFVVGVVIGLLAR